MLTVEVKGGMNPDGRLLDQDLCIFWWMGSADHFTIPKRCSSNSCGSVSKKSMASACSCPQAVATKDIKAQMDESVI